MAASTQGILAWTASIRTAMINDPGRKLFEEQVQTQGFSFLDEYLNNILAEPKKDDVIVDLLKTPGRRKAAAKKTRAGVAAAARAQNAISLSLEDEGDSKENFAPVNAFHKALLQAKSQEGNEDVQRQPSPQRQRSVPLVDLSAKAQPKKKAVKKARTPEPMERDDMFIEIMSSSPQPPLLSLPEDDVDPMHHQPSTSHLTPSVSDHSNELSIIAEDDEPAERSRISVQPSHVSPAPPRDPSPLAPIVEAVVRSDARENDEHYEEDVDDVQMDTDDFTRATAITVSDSGNTFHSIPLANSPPRDEAPVSPEEHVRDSQPRATPVEDAVPSGVPSMPTRSSLYPSTTELTIPLRDHDSTEAGLHRKPSLSQFPTLPAPSPLKKSTRLTREPSVGTSLQAQSAATAAAAKRTSWLTMAREVKALEVTQKRASVVNAGVPSGSRPSVNVPKPLSGGNKRKSGDMLGAASNLDKETATESAERRPKVPKMSADITDAFYDIIEVEDTVAFKPEVIQAPGGDIRTARSANDVDALSNRQDAVLDFFKKTVDAHSTRPEKSAGGTAANELAEARKAAEARVAERHKVETDVEEPPRVRPSFSAPALSLYPALPDERPLQLPQPSPKPQRSKRDSDKRLSVSDLISPKKAAPYQTLQPGKAALSDISTSTTPPHSPPPPTRQSSFILPPGPVFNKPPAVFVPPPAAAPAASEPKSGNGIGKDFSFKLPTSSSFQLRSAFTLGLQPSLASSASPRQPSTNSGASTQASVSDAVFDSQEDAPAWAPRTQESAFTSQESFHEGNGPELQDDDMDDDDSWRYEDKFAAPDQMWTPFGAVTTEDSMTWSTVPTESQRAGDSGPIFRTREQAAQDLEDDLATRSRPFDQVVDDHEMAVETGEGGWEQDITEAGKSTVSLVEQKGGLRSQSQLSVASSSGQSSEAVGFFGQATKLVSSMLGVSKKGKELPKSIQMAAAVAKKHQEEQDKKATRLKDMEARRQAALQRKAEEEKTKAEEAEKKLRNEAERRKKDREEHTGKRPLKLAEQKSSDDEAKKRKPVVEAPKAKLPSKEKKEPTRLTKPSPNPQAAVKKSIMKQPSSSNLNTAASSSKIVESKSTKAAPPSAKGKGKALASNIDDDLGDRQPSKVVQSQMAARIKNQVQATKQPEEPPRMASELIDLPEPNSEYSDSDDEDRKKFDAPTWAQSPELRAALESQSTVNPDDIFGPVQPLRMEELFRTRHSRFRARTSSANWSGPDGLKRSEELEYARRMGFR